MRLRVCTFNVENLAARQSFGPKARPETGPALSLFDVQEPERREVVQQSLAVALEELAFFSKELRILGVYPAHPFRETARGPAE